MSDYTGERVLCEDCGKISPKVFSDQELARAGLEAHGETTGHVVMAIVENAELDQMLFEAYAGGCHPNIVIAALAGID